MLLDVAKGIREGHDLRTSPVGRAGTRHAAGRYQHRKAGTKENRDNSRGNQPEASCRSKAAPPSRCKARVGRRCSQLRPASVVAPLAEAGHRKCSEQLAARAAALRGSAAALPRATAQEYLTYA